MTDRPDLNVLMREVIDLAREARRLARAGGNDVAASSADNFEQGAANAYRNQNREQLENNLTAARSLVEHLRALTPKA
ncbi:hypothetical protein [Deinococcus pimensis]|uniref:hypothetical protein n=1 Tax=Deinococcus pimensis TaxID=309888 RepID=UPI000489224D|nr:hypothetical protein [Deinococcus pimensis]